MDIASYLQSITNTIRNPTAYFFFASMKTFAYLWTTLVCKYFSSLKIVKGPVIKIKEIVSFVLELRTVYR